MKKIGKNLPVYVLAIALVVSSIINANQAQSHSTDTSRIRSLEREIASLRSCINSNLQELSFALNPNTKWRFFERRC